MKLKVLIATTTFALAGPAVAAGPGGPAPAKSSAVKLEAIPGSPVKRITLSSKALERLGIEVGKVGMQPIVRTQMVSGLVVPAMDGTAAPRMVGGVFGGFTPVGAAPIITKKATDGEAWLLVTLSEAEWNRLAKDKPARVLPLATRDKLSAEVSALPTGMQPMMDSKRSMLSLYYKLKQADDPAGLAVNKRMRVELQLAGSEEKNKVVPYSAVYYDAKGTAWVYLNPQPLVFERHRIGLERVIGQVAVLSEGPPEGTTVVTVGAPLLYGTEIFGK